MDVSATLGASSGGSGSGTSSSGSGSGSSSGGAGASLDFTFSLSDQVTDAIAVTSTSSFQLVASGADADGIDHGNDQFWLWINPQLNFAIDPTGNVEWSINVNGTMLVIYVLVSQLKNPATMRPDVRATLSAAGLTENDFAQILATDPFAANPNATIDLDRYNLMEQAYTYEPPAADNQQDSQGITLSSSETNTITKSVTQTYALSVKGSVPLMTALNLAVSDQLTYTIQNSRQTLSTATQTAVGTIAGPSSAYTGPTDLLGYWDTVFHSIMFAFPRAPLTVIASGTILDNLGQAVVNAVVTLTVGSQTLSTYTGLSGDYRFYGASTTGQGNVTIKGQQFPVTIGQTVPKQVLKLAPSKPIPGPIPTHIPVAKV